MVKRAKYHDGRNRAYHADLVSRRESPLRHGFTLIDLTVTVLIIGIIGAVAIPRYAETLNRYRAESAAKRIVADLTLARQQAMSSSASQTVRFTTPAANSYTLVGMSDLNHSSATYVVDLSASPYNTSINSANFGGDADLIFNGFGIPDSNGSVVVVSGGYKVTVTVDPDTGKATIP